MSNTGGGEKEMEHERSHTHMCTCMIFSQICCLSWRRLRKKVKMSLCVCSVYVRNTPGQAGQAPANLG